MDFPYSDKEQCIALFFSHSWVITSTNITLHSGLGPNIHHPGSYTAAMLECMVWK